MMAAPTHQDSETSSRNRLNPAEPTENNSSPSTPPRSRSSSASSSRSSSRKSPKNQLSLDLSDLPALSQPARPSNTLLITNLQDPAIFTPTTLARVRELIAEHAPAGVHSFSPLRALQRIIISFPDVDSAIAIRSLLDGETVFGSRIRVYFGEPTSMQELSEKEKHLQAPKSAKQFFISPPPSPPHGWESRDEDPPNKQVHPEDLASALESLNRRKDAVDSAVPLPAPPAPPSSSSPGKSTAHPGRSRSRSSTLVYDPEEHGKSADLPAIAVEDTGVDSDEEFISGEAYASDSDSGIRPAIRQQKTSRPPVELMHQSQDAS